MRVRFECLAAGSRLSSRQSLTGHGFSLATEEDVSAESSELRTLRLIVGFAACLRDRLSLLFPLIGAERLRVSRPDGPSLIARLISGRKSLAGISGANCAQPHLPASRPIFLRIQYPNRYSMSPGATFRCVRFPSIWSNLNRSIERTFSWRLCWTRKVAASGMR